MKWAIVAKNRAKIWNVICLVVIILLWGTAETRADTLAERLDEFPQWQSKPTVEIASGDLIYPEWMEGTWEVTSTLSDLVAPLAPKLVTPGFEGNRQYLNIPVKFRVKFTKKYLLPAVVRMPPAIAKGPLVVAEREFNGLRIARAYLGDDVLSVKVDPNNPNRQIAFLRDRSQLISTITGRHWESPATDRFISTEITQQIFKGKSRIYIDEVETTTAYRHQGARVEAEQVTAIYLSPQDPNYFLAIDRPVALYRYKLDLSKA